jgi:hypothetical protein
MERKHEMMEKRRERAEGHAIVMRERPRIAKRHRPRTARASSVVERARAPGESKPHDQLNLTFPSTPQLNKPSN